MKTYKDYYKLSNDREWMWYKDQKEEWWRKYENPLDMFSDKLDLKGDYLETTRIKSKHEKNNSSMIANHTNVTNWEWSILSGMLGQALIDWLIENKKTDIYAFGFSMEKIVDNGEEFYVVEKSVKMLEEDKMSWKEIDVPDPEFDECAGFLCDIVHQFFTKQGKDIPCDWNYFAFGLDDLSESCKYGQWCPCSDGSMTLGNLHDGVKFDTYDEYLSCM